MNAANKIIIINLLRRKSVQLSILLTSLMIGVFTTLSYQNFHYLQAQNISQLSVFNEIIKPLSGLIFFTQLIMIIVVAAQSIPYLAQRGQLGLLIHSVKSDGFITKQYLTTLFVIGNIPFIVYLLINLTLLYYTQIDWQLLASTGSALLIGSLIFSCLVLSVSAFSKNTLVAFIASIFLLVVVITIDELLRRQSVVSHWSIFLDFFLHLREGLINIFDIYSFLLWLGLFFSIALFSIKSLRLKKTTNTYYLIALLSIAIVLFAIARSQFLEKQTNSFQWDISQRQLNSLPTDIVSDLANIESKIIISAVIDKEENHDEINRAFAIIQQYQHNAALTFASRQALLKDNIHADQFVRISLGEKQKTIRYPFEESAKEVLVEAVLQLSNRNEQWITFIEGHGEASPFSSVSSGINLFYQSLKKQGWPIAFQNLQKQSKIADNTQILIIAGGKSKWLPVEIESLLSYLRQGGNLLLLLEQEDSFPRKILNFLAIKKTNGVLIDWQGYQNGTPHPAIIIVNKFNEHPLNSGINSLLAFPWVSGLEATEQSIPDYEKQTILTTHSGVWNEFNADQTELAFNQEQGEQQGAFDIAISLQHKNKPQKIIVIGDSSFLSDAAINNYANKQFSFNLINWLSSQNTHLISDQYADNFIQINLLSHFIFSWFFSAVLPIIMIILWLFFSFRRKRLTR